MVVHKHLIVRAEVENPIIIPRKAKDWLKRLVQAIGMKITRHGGPHCDYVKKPGNEGIAAIAMIETSHISLHIWNHEIPPLVQMDVYSCADFEVGTVLTFVEEMKPRKIYYKLLDRMYDVAESDCGMIEKE